VDNEVLAGIGVNSTKPDLDHMYIRRLIKNRLNLLQSNTSWSREEMLYDVSHNELVSQGALLSAHLHKEIQC
jgi:hypothetical protein